MSLIVQKFGGSSVATTDRLNLVANHIKKELELNNKVVVVVSAQNKMTDNLISQEKEITEINHGREHDVLVSTGEQITIAKLAMVLKEKNIKAISLTGWQIPIITDSNYSNARIRYINNETIEEYLNVGNVVIIAGFQGVDELNNITTLGRGGSDTTAVALAASLNADRCDIYTDVDGVFVADPRIISEAEKLKQVSYDEMLELASMGAKVLHNRCVEIGKKYNVPIYVKSTFEENSTGTLIDSNNLETTIISGITKNDKIIHVSLKNIENKTEISKLFENLSKNQINVDMITMNLNDKNNIDFIINLDDLSLTSSIIEKLKQNLNYKDVNFIDNVAKVSIIGTGITNKTEIIGEIFEVLRKNNIDIKLITTSEIKISIVIDIKEVTNAMIAINNIFVNRGK